MNHVEQVVDAVVALRTLTVRQLEVIMNVSFAKDAESPYADFFVAHGSNPRFLARLTMDRRAPCWLLSVDFGTEFPCCRGDLDLARFGKAVSCTANPDIGPEGVASYIYRYREMKLVFAFTSSTERLAYFVIERERSVCAS